MQQVAQSGLTQESSESQFQRAGWEELPPWAELQAWELHVPAFS